MARTETVDAILLRAVPYGDSDKIVTLLTSEHGKCAVIARGARRSKRRFAGALEPYQLLRAEVGFGRGDVGRLAAAQVVRAYIGVLSDLRRMTLAAAGIELLRAVLPDRDRPDPALFPTALRFFELSEESARAELRIAFTARVLAICGLAPNLDECGVCGLIAPPNKPAYFDIARGAIVCRSCGGARDLLSGSSRAALRRAAGPEWESVAQGSPDITHAIQDVQAVLDRFLEHQLGKKLHGSSMLAQLGARTDEDE